MEINGKIPVIKIDAYVNNINKKNKVDAPEKNQSKPVPNEDKVHLSQNARDVKEAREKLDAIPDVDEAKVAEIKNRVEKGTYKVDGKKIAFNMIRDSLIDETV